MNHWFPDWDTPARPDDYRAETRGPYTPPTPSPAPREPVRPPAWSVLAIVGACAALLIGGLYLSASRDTEPVPIPNTTTLTETPAPERFTPNAHKPGPPVSNALSRGGLLIVGADVAPGIYRSVVVPRYLAGREDNGYCYVSRLNTTEPDLSQVRTSYNYAPNGPIIADASYRETGQRVTLKILASDKAVEIDCGDASWSRVG